MTAAAIAADLRAAVDAALEGFRDVHESHTMVRPAAGKWCAREILGHLVDSACNNHRRFVIGQHEGVTAFDAYDQNAWVASQHYADRPFKDILALWAAYNHHLAHVIAATPEHALAHTGRAPGGGGEVSLRFLMQDYVDHLRHHLAQLRQRLTT